MVYGCYIYCNCVFVVDNKVVGFVVNVGVLKNLVVGGDCVV